MVRSDPRDEPKQDAFGERREGFGDDEIPTPTPRLPDERRQHADHDRVGERREREPRDDPVADRVPRREADEEHGQFHGDREQVAPEKEGPQGVGVGGHVFRLRMRATES